MDKKYDEIKKKAMADFGVEKTESFSPEKAIRDRINYLKEFVKKTNKSAIVLGISGGVDSSTAGKLSQLAVSELQKEGYDACFVAMRLPYKEQKDEEDAQKALDFIQPDKVLTVDIANGVDGLFNAGINACFESNFKENQQHASSDFVKGNIKARMRMVAQYQIAGMFNGLVLGTDHNAEGLLSFYTKWGDQSCDLIVLDGLNKRQVRLCAKTLGAPQNIYEKAPTADLEDEKPQLLDEVATGIPYDDLDDFLEGKEISKDMERKILDFHLSTAHKRSLPTGFTN